MFRQADVEESGMVDIGVVPSLASKVFGQGTHDRELAIVREKSQQYSGVCWHGLGVHAHECSCARVCVCVVCARMCARFCLCVCIMCVCMCMVLYVFVCMQAWDIVTVCLLFSSIYHVQVYCIHGSPIVHVFSIACRK